MRSGQHNNLQTEEKNDESAVPSQQQLDSVLGMYKTCLRSQSNWARMFAGAAQSTNRPTIGGLTKTKTWQNSEEYRSQFLELEKNCDGYKKEWDALYQRMYRR